MAGPPAFAALPAASTGPGLAGATNKIYNSKIIILYFQEICSYVN